MNSLQAIKETLDQRITAIEEDIKRLERELYETVRKREELEKISEGLFNSILETIQPIVQPVLGECSKQSPDNGTVPVLDDLISTDRLPYEINFNKARAYFVENDNKYATTKDIVNGTGLTINQANYVLRSRKTKDRFEVKKINTSVGRSYNVYFRLKDKYLLLPSTNGSSATTLDPTTVH